MSVWYDPLQRIPEQSEANSSLDRFYFHCLFHLFEVICVSSICIGVGIFSRTNKEQKFYQKLRDIFVGAEIEGRGGFINLMRIKSRYYRKVESYLKLDIEDVLSFDKVFCHRIFFFKGKVGRDNMIFSSRKE
ncbi:MAG: hypothetical protein QW279_03720 [Candidatus Jordarchaeaceae archaeon]